MSSCRCDQLDGDPKEVSPIFTQFLECVWQLTEQFPQVYGSASALCILIYVLSLLPDMSIPGIWWEPSP